MSKKYIQTKKSAFIVGVVIFIILVILDQYTKSLIVHYTEQLYNAPLVIIPHFFDIATVRNTGIAWGMFGGNNIFFLCIVLAAIIIFSCCFRVITEGYSERVIGFFMIIAGIVGNGCDRIYRGAVVDFLDFHYYQYYHWPAFNVADSCICVGVIIIVISTLLRKSKKTLES